MALRIVDYQVRFLVKIVLMPTTTTTPLTVALTGYERGGELLEDGEEGLADLGHRVLVQLPRQREAALEHRLVKWRLH
jgi:hypothetical protein